MLPDPSLMFTSPHAGDLDAARGVVHAQVRARRHLHDEIDARVAVPAEPAAAAPARVVGVEPAVLQGHFKRPQPVLVGRAQRGLDPEFAGPVASPDHQFPGAGVHRQARARRLPELDVLAKLAVVLGRESRGDQCRRAQERRPGQGGSVRHVSFLSVG